MPRIILCSLLVLGTCGAANAQKDLPAPLAVISPQASTKAAVPAVAQHLRKAAEHLEAAGLNEHAQHFRHIADKVLARRRRELEVQLEQKLAQLEQLQKQVDELRQRIGKVQQVEFQVQVLELNLEKLREMEIKIDGFDADRLVSHGFSGVFQADSAERLASPVAVVEQEKKLQHLIKRLKSENVLKVLAEPQIITTNGRPAAYRSGGEFPVVVPAGGTQKTVEWREFGLSLEVVPRMKSGGKVEVQIDCELAEREFGNSVQTAGLVVPALSTSRINTQVVMDLQRTLILGGMRTESVDGEGRKTATERVVLITPKGVEPLRKSALKVFGVSR